MVPSAFAVLLTVAAGLSLAEEHGWAPSVVPEGSVTSSDSSGKSTKGAMPDKGALDLRPGSTGGQIHDAATPKPGVGSRALAGHDEEKPATHERSNTDLDEGSQSLD
jgi:hypothetical protein